MRDVGDAMRCVCQRLLSAKFNHVCFSRPDRQQCVRVRLHGIPADHRSFLYCCQRRHCHFK